MSFGYRSYLYLTAVVMTLATILTSMAEAQQPTSPTTRPTLWLVGDSTVKVGTAGQMGWGDPIIKRFDPAKIRVENRAIGGRSSRTFQTEGRWDKVLEEMRPGDYVMVQLGHNDASALAGDNRERGTIRGIGEETEEVTLTLGANKDKKEVVHTYGWYMRKYVTDAKAKGATPIVLSYVPRCPRPPATGATSQPAAEPILVPAELSSYALWARQIAEQEKVPFIDLHRLILRKWVALGLTAEQIKEQFFNAGDYTHTDPNGAAFNAERVIEGLQQLDLPLKDYVLQK